MHGVCWPSITDLSSFLFLPLKIACSYEQETPLQRGLVDMIETLVKRGDEKVLSSDLYFCVLIASSIVAWAFCLELTWLDFYTFRRWSGLYFYAILISAWGCSFHAAGWLSKYVTDIPNALFLVIVEVGKCHFSCSFGPVANAYKVGFQWSPASRLCCTQGCIWSYGVDKF